ncbi:hypothetical protein [Pacificoceanicola onchidii]|uniref:hypothetical protein n=1 Tax=Pacificoceanicola onchidii TaxID=2562685 RepID=UPI0010A4D9C1|nr:hypothetical protein [Pacificoceanicola onchidii]
MEQVYFQLPHDMLVVAAQMARERDITVGQLVRNLLASEISRRKNARPPNRADEQLVAPLRARLAPVIAEAQGWDTLQSRLAAMNFEFRAAGGGLALHRLNGERLCKASELGFSYSRLIERFRAPFPGHSHTWVAERILSRQNDEADLMVIDTADQGTNTHPNL